MEPSQPDRPDPFAGRFRTQPEPAPEPPAASRRRVPRWVTAAAAPAAVGAAVALGVAALAGGGGGTTTVTVQADATLPPAVTAPAETRAPDGDAAADDLPVPAGSRTVAGIVKDVSPAVTLVVSGDRATGGALGTGFLVDRAGHLLTNAHVIEDDAKTATVTFVDGTEEEARVLGRDEGIDLAVLRVPRVPAGVEPIPLGTIRNLRVGDPLVAIGNPLGLQQSVSTGIVSALKRTITSPNETSIQNVVQTDAAINQGNSGGPLLDRRGLVVGINSQIATESGGNDGIGFAAPIDTIRPVADSIIATGTPRHAWMGIEGVTITPRIAAANGLGARRGVMVVRADDRGPARAGGVRGATSGTGTGRDEIPKGGDVIVAVDGRAVRDMGDVSLAIASKRVGQRATVTVLRDGSERDVTVTLADRPATIR